MIYFSKKEDTVKALDISRYILTKCKRDNHLISAMQLQGILYFRSVDELYDAIVEDEE